MENPLELTSKLQAIPGYLYGLKNSSLLLNIKLNNNTIHASVFKNILHDINSLSLAKNHINSNEIKEDTKLDHFSHMFLESIYSIQKASFWPIFEKGFLIQYTQDNSHYQFAIPTINNAYRALSVLVVQLINFINVSIKNEGKEKNLAQLKNLIIQLEKIKPKSTNMPHLLYTANMLEIPFRQIQDTLYQYGYGRESRWLDSTFTDKTSVISSKIARNKNLTSLILKEAGFPVAKQRVIKNASEAFAFAKQFGFPIVIKPFNLDGGVGVSVGLDSEQAIIDAFKKALKFSKKIIVEKHIYGRDYRLVVFNGSLIWAIERMPACIIGDGKNSIKELIKIENKNPHRGNSDSQPLKYLMLDEEALKIIKSNGYNEDTIPANQERVLLRLHANISSGGMPISVFDKVHEDNKILAIKAAEALKLDLSGIDLIIDDISKSWKEIGASICEINAQPMLGSLTSFHLYEKILKEMLPRNGRIPIVLVIGKDENHFIEKLSFNFRSRKINLIIIESSELSIKNSVASIYNQTLSALNDKETEGLIVNITENSILKNGIPCQYVDALILCGSNSASEKESIDLDSMNSLIEAFIPMSRNKPILIGSYNPEVQKQKYSSPVTYSNIDEAIDSTTKDLFAFYNL